MGSSIALVSGADYVHHPSLPTLVREDGVDVLTRRSLALTRAARNGVNQLPLIRKFASPLKSSPYRTPARERNSGSRLRPPGVSGSDAACRLDP